MRFEVPQFIEIEDKIFGPLSFKQFAYVVGGAGLGYLFYRLLPIYIAVIPMVASVGLGLALAFYQVNKKPFIFTLQAAFGYFTKGKLYIWKKEPKTPEEMEKENEDVVPSNLNPDVHIPKLSDSKLKELSWSLGVKESLYKETDEAQGREK